MTPSVAFGRRCIQLLIGVLITHTANGQLLLNGPIVTHTTMHSIQVWAQLDGEGTTQLEYWLADAPEQTWRSRPATAIYKDAHIVKLTARVGIEPNQRYGYRLL